MHQDLVGTSIVLSLDGQKIMGRISEVRPDKLVVRISILQPAKPYKGVNTIAKLPDGQVVVFDLGAQSYFSELLIEVPLPADFQVAERQRTTGDALVEAKAKAPLQNAATKIPEPLTPKAASVEQRTPAKPVEVKPEVVEANTVTETPPVDGQKPPEKRSYFRFAVACRVDVVEDDGRHKERVVAFGNTVNLSGGGMLAEFDQAIPGGVFLFRLHLTEEESLLLQGKVLHKNAVASNRVAVQFVNLHEADRSKLIRFIFNMLRGLRRGDESAYGSDAAKKAKSKDEKKGYQARREKYYQAPKIRYW